MSINTNWWNRVRYTMWAPIYDFVASMPAHRRRSLELLAPQPGEELLIVGAGTGQDLAYIPPGVNVTAVDLTPAMVERLKERANRLGLPVDAQVMDGQALTFPSDRFDAVVLHLVVAVIPDPVACLQEAARVLRPGGRVLVWDKFIPDDQEPSLLRRLANIFTNALFSDVTRKLGPIVAQTPLVFEHREQRSILGVPFQTALLRKP